MPLTWWYNDRHTADRCLFPLTTTLVVVSLTLSLRAGPTGDCVATRFVSTHPFAGILK